jgi:hypothetical protein
MKKSPHTTRTCRSYRAGEKRGLALGLAAVGCQRVWGEKHGSEHGAKLTNKPPHKGKRTYFMH